MKYIKTFEKYSVNEIFGLSKEEKTQKAQERVDAYLLKSNFLQDENMNKKLGKEGIEEIKNMYPDLFENLDFDHSPMLYLPKEELLKKYKSKKWYAAAIDRAEKHAEESYNNWKEKGKNEIVPKETYDQGMSSEDQYNSIMANVNRRGY
jgi:hypothetical protein